jgi:hypothetical protein
VAGRQLVESQLEEGGGQARAQCKSQGADARRLEQNHPGQSQVGDADGLQRAELLQVVDREEVEGLSRDDGPHHERHRDRDSEVDGDACVPQVVAHAVPHELPGRPGPQAGLLLDARRELLGRNARGRPGDQERELGPLPAHEADRLAVAGVHDREAGERRRGVRDADDPHQVVVHLESPIQPEGFLREEQDVSRLVDHHRVGLPEALPGAEQHTARCSCERRVIETDQERRRELAGARARDGVALEEPNRPADAGDASDPCQIRVLQRLGLVPILRLGIHDPDLGIRHVEHLARRAPQDVGEDRGLVLQQERAEGDREHQAEVLGPVARQHAQRHEVHELVLRPNEMMIIILLGKKRRHC